jgi:predicted DsbA family dithiol-disulfide isomerase
MRVEVWSDVICPWCYIGKRRFESALSQYAGAEDVEIVYRAYQLDPSAAPGEAMAAREGYARKFGGYEQADRIIRQVSDVAAQSGLDFHMDRARRANTLLAHRLLWMAEDRGGSALQGALKERLLAAYFVNGEHVGDPETLRSIALAVGLVDADVDAVLDGSAGLAEVAAEIDLANDLGITAVPTYVFEGRWSVPGAQDPEVFLNVLGRVEKMLADARALEPVVADGSTCTDDGCEI